MSYKLRAKDKGFTLAEAMIATVILGIAAAGVLMPFTSGLQVRAEGRHRTLAAKLAADLMEEIINIPSGQIVDGYERVELQGQVKDATDAIFTDLNYANFSRDVSCVYVDVPQESGAAEANFIRVTVRVYYSGREIVSLRRLISR